MPKMIGYCDCCHSIFNESFIDNLCPECKHSQINYKPYEFSYEELSYSLPKINNPIDYLYPKENIKLYHNPNKNNKKHFFHIIPIYLKADTDFILTSLTVAWDYNFSDLYSIYENSEKLLHYTLSNFSLNNFMINRNPNDFYFDIITVGCEKESYDKFIDCTRDLALSNLSNYFQLYTSIQWGDYENTSFKKTFYEYASVNYLLHLMEICKIGSMFDDFDSKLYCVQQLPSLYDCFLRSMQDLKTIDNLIVYDKNPDKLDTFISFKEELIGNNEIVLENFEDIFEYYSNLSEGALAPVSVPLSAAAVRSTSVYNKLYDLGYNPSLNVYSKLNATTLCPSFVLEDGSTCYIECNNNIMKGINVFDSKEEMISCLEEVYNEEMEDSMFLKLNNIPSSVINFIIYNSKNNKEFLTRIIDLKDKYSDEATSKKFDISDYNKEIDLESELKNLKKVELTNSTLFKYRNTHFKLRNKKVLGGTNHGYLFIDKNDNVAAYVISEDINNDYYIYKDIPFETINVITDIEVVSEYKNKNVEEELIKLMINDFKSVALKTNNSVIINICNNKYKPINEIKNTHYYWLKSSINENLTLQPLNEALNPSKRKKIEETIYKTFEKLDKSGLNTKKYQEKFKSMSNDAFEKYMKVFLNDKKRNFYLEVLPNKNAPKIKDVKEALDYIGVPFSEYVYYRHDGNKDDPIRTRYKVPVLLVSMRRLQQCLSKKNTYSLDVDKRNIKTDTVTGDERIARISDAENYCLLTYKDDSKTLKEFLGCRADSRDARQTMYKEISKQGYFYLKDLPNDITKKQSLNTVNTLLIGAGIDNDLLVPDNLINSLNKLNN